MAATEPAAVTDHVRRQTLDQTVLATGVIRPEVGAEIDVGSRVSGIVSSLPVKVGNRVDRGDLLARIDPTDIPVTTAMRRLSDVEHLDRIYVQAESEEAISSVRADVASLLRRRHFTLVGGSDDFVIKDQTALVRAQQEAGGSLSWVVNWLSALALGLGGVGLLAVSLLSVRERYGEIGLRLAVGGRPRDILLQFLTEAVLISALGGLAGLAVGAVGVVLGASVTRWPMVLSWQGVVYPLAISVAIAVFFGAYPALRAARLDPIQALNSR